MKITKNDILTIKREGVYYVKSTIVVTFVIIRICNEFITALN